MQARQLWLGRLPPTRPGEGVRIPGIPFAHFILTGLLRHRAGTLDACLDNLARHADATVRSINGWRRRNDRWVQRAIPDGAKPLSDPATTARFFLETQFPALMKLGTAVAHFDSVFAEVAAATEIAKDVRVWNLISGTTASTLARYARSCRPSKRRGSSTCLDRPMPHDVSICWTRVP